MIDLTWTIFFGLVCLFFIWLIIEGVYDLISCIFFKEKNDR
jgi:hypothetical protein